MHIFANVLMLSGILILLTDFAVPIFTEDVVIFLMFAVMAFLLGVLGMMLQTIDDLGQIEEAETDE